MLKKNMLSEAEKGQTFQCVAEQEIVAEGQSFSANATAEGCSLSRNCVIGSVV